MGFRTKSPQQNVEFSNESFMQHIKIVATENFRFEHREYSRLLVFSRFLGPTQI